MSSTTNPLSKDNSVHLLGPKNIEIFIKVVIMESKFFNDYYSDIKSSNNQNDIFKIMFILKMCKVPLIKSGQNVIYIQ